MNENRLKTLLYNAIVLLEDVCEEIVVGSYLEDELGITVDEYDEIMRDNIINRVEYLRRKEQVCPLDDEERYFLLEND